MPDEDAGFDPEAPVAVVLGSAFGAPPPDFEPVDVVTAHGKARLWRYENGYAVFRHGVPHTRLPNQVPYRAHAAALQAMGVGALLVTSSVGVLQPDVPLFLPLLVDDLVWLDNRLPDGSACTMFPTETEGQGHLVVEQGLFDAGLADQIRGIAANHAVEVGAAPVTFWYAPGPRTKTAAENRVLAGMGLQVNSMTLAPEVVLANELAIPCAAVVVGHKASGPGLGEVGVRRSLESARTAVETLVLAFLREGRAVAFRNHLYRF
jgi:5'-methylthioadenosine phosphorylase